MKEELDSQLSAMYDDELPAAECELLARRLSRDDQLKARWARYAVIGATIRAERGARLDSNLARRVSTALGAEPAFIAAAVRRRPRPLAASWWRPFAGAAVAASVAAASILWLRYQAIPEMGPGAALTASVSGSPPSTATTRTRGAPDSYVVPRAPARRMGVPATELANYVVAHSEFSSPVTRRNLLSTLMASESGTSAANSAPDDTPEDVYDDVKSAQ
jgi:sigma-E factor negative regulatory protein RseA